MILFPGNAIQGDCFQKVYDILSSIIVWSAIAVLRHEYDGHSREKAHDFPAKFCRPVCILSDFLLYGNNGEGYSLLDYDRPVYHHANHLFLILSKIMITA